MEMWELVARESIRDLVARYNANGDSGRFDQVVELFAPDAEMELADGTRRGHEEIRSIFTGVRGTVTATGAVKHMRHMTSTHQIDLVDPSTATGRSYFAVLTDAGVDHWGRYLDDYRTVGGAWRFARRRVVTDGFSRDSFVASRPTPPSPHPPSSPPMPG